MPINLYPHQQEALASLKSGSILCGGVGSGKSITALSYYFLSQGVKDIYIITTARKRDVLEWDKEASYFLLSKNDRETSVDRRLLIVDSWNNIHKYVGIENAFFLFDEQRVVGSGAWVKSFLKITKTNEWLLLTATPGDTWSDYIPAFIANGFYKNRTEFIRKHVVFNNFSKFPKIDHYVECKRLVDLKQAITVYMSYEKKTIPHKVDLVVDHNKDQFALALKSRWNPFTDQPIKDITSLCYVLRKVVNSDPSRLEAVKTILVKHPKIIVFYNFNYELDILRHLGDGSSLTVAEYNGHKHEPIPTGESWVYLVQYASGSEGWNCIETDTIVFYSLNYSYRATTQAAGRIDRINTPFTDLYYYYIRSTGSIDVGILKALSNKRAFNENSFARV